MCGDYPFATKFHDPRFLGIADLHYLIAPKGVVMRNSLPPQWGLLDETPAVALPAPRKEARKNTGIVSNFLRAIARSNTTSMMRSQGMAFHRGEAALTPGATARRATRCIEGALPRGLARGVRGGRQAN